MLENCVRNVSERKDHQLPATVTTMTMAVSSSSAKRGSQLRGPRPQSLKVSSSSSKKTHGGAAPVIVYEHTPKVVHARPQEFMTVVQRLTGKPAPAPAPLPTTSTYVPAGLSLATTVEEGTGGDPLLLTLGQRQAAVPSPSPMAAGMLQSPGFIFSPNTMQSIQELTPLF